MSALKAFDYLAYVIPGAVLLYVVMWLSPKLKAPLVEEKIDLGSFGIFIILAFVAGLLIHGFAHYLPEKWVMRPLGLVHRTEALVCPSNPGASGLSKATADKLKLDQKAMAAACNDEDKKKDMLGLIFAGEHKSGIYHERVELFEARYYMLLDLAAVFLILIPVSLYFRPKQRASSCHCYAPRPFWRSNACLISTISMRASFFIPSPAHEWRARRVIAPKQGWNSAVTLPAARR